MIGLLSTPRTTTQVTTVKITVAESSLTSIVAVNQVSLVTVSSIVSSLLLGTMLLSSNVQAASCQLPKSFYKNVSCTADSNYFLAVKDFGAPVALIDKNGKRVADLLQYQRVDASKIASGLMPVQRNSRVGYVNIQGREVVPTRYDIINSGSSWARAVSDGRIVVKSNGNYGVISTNNQIIIPFSSAIDTIDDYRNGTARVVRANAISVVDKSGNIKTSPSSTPDLQAKTSAPSAAETISTNAIQRNAFTTLQPQQRDGKWGFVDDQEVIMVTYSFDNVRPFSEGLAGVQIDSQWGFVNLGGELVIPFGFADKPVPNGENYKGVSTFVFNDGKAWIGSLENGSKMCISKAGAMVGCDL